MVNYFHGDLFQSDCNVVCHQCNCRGAYNAGIAKVVRNLYPQAYMVFMRRYRTGNSKLGEIDVVPCAWIVGKMRYVINMYSQDTFAERHKRHTDYNAFQECLNKIKYFANNHPGVKIGFPTKIGCGLAGGDWDIVRKMIDNTFADSKYNVEIWEI